jgi:hypothetical protein
MQLKKIAGWAVVVFIAYYLLTKPTGAGHFVQTVIGWLKDAGSSIATFLNSL